MNSAYSGMLFGLIGAIVLDIPADRRELPIVERSVGDHHGASRSARRHHLDVVRTGTTLSVPALTGAIMCMGVATANAVLVISFARERLADHGDPVQAALESGFVRIRPVLMTALAMVIGMAPMALASAKAASRTRRWAGP